jgi:hypothetical protein
MSITIDAAYVREKIRACLRLASALPWNNPMRYQLLLMAEDLRRCEKELEGRASTPHDVGEECRSDPEAPAVKREAEEDWGRR